MSYQDQKKTVVLSAAGTHFLISIKADTVEEFFKNYSSSNYENLTEKQPPTDKLGQYSFKFQNIDSKYHLEDGGIHGGDVNQVLPTGLNTSGDVKFDFSVHFTVKKIDAGSEEKELPKNLEEFIQGLLIKLIN